MKRLIDDQLRSWKKSSTRPLLLLGARQVGKTYSVRTFGESEFPRVAYVNFQTDLERLSAVFSGPLNPRRIVSDLELLLGYPIEETTCLLIFDEVQLCQAALTSLKYFAEDAPGFRVVATGSEVGVTVHREPRFSFPVGKVDTATLHPMTFEEVCWAAGHADWPQAIRDHLLAVRPLVVHDDVLTLYWNYLMVGGMPDIVSTWLRGADWSAVRQAQAHLTAVYPADAGLYLPDGEATRTQAIWRSAPHQLARARNKFILADVAKGARAAAYEPGFAWLEQAGLIHRHRQVEAPIAPLQYRGDGSFFKVYLLDVGLLGSALGVRPESFLATQTRQSLSGAFRGALAENAVKQALEAQDIISGYWSSGNTAEVDFLVVNADSQVIPVETKSADNVRSRSLAAYVDHYHPTYSIRLSTKNFGRDGSRLSFPLYAAFALAQFLDGPGG